MTSTITMPSVSTERQPSSAFPTEKFPDLDLQDISNSQLGAVQGTHTNRSSAGPLSPGKTNETSISERWQPRGFHKAWGSGTINVAGPRGHGRQRSLTDAMRNIRDRRGSMGANAHELAEALKAPLSVKLVVSFLTAKRQPIYFADRWC